MDPILILYKSKYGASKAYAAMLAGELSCEARDLASCPRLDPAPGERIIFVGGIYAGGVAGLSLLRKKCPGLDPGRLAVFCVGASPFDPKALEELQKRLPSAWRDVPLFYGRGAWDESKMTWPDRALCGLLQRAVSKKGPEEREPWMEALLSARGQAHDWTDPVYLEPLLAYIRSGAGVK